MAQAATVYRIEHKMDKGGMYAGSRMGVGLYNIARREGDDLYGESRHPTPAADSVLMATDIPKGSWSDRDIGDIAHLHFGFISIEQLRSWIYKDSWLEGLHEAGYVLAIIESDEVYVGSTQAVFRRPETYPTFCIKEYFNL